MIVDANIGLLDPWGAVSEPRAAKLEEELGRELASGHVLFGRRAKAVAVRCDCDDVLFELRDPPQLAVVHLGWGVHHELPPWPRTELYSDLADFVERSMKPDHLDYIDEAAQPIGV